MKSEPIKREICGTERGYRTHRKTNEVSCQECRDAHNVYRRAHYNPDKNRQHVTKYKTANQKLVKERAKKYNLSPEEKALRAAARREATLAKQALAKEAKEAQLAAKVAAKVAARQAKDSAHKAQMAENAEQRRLAKAARDTIKAEKAALAKAQREAEQLAAREAKQAERLKAKQERAEAKAAAKLLAAANLVIQHGTTSGYKYCSKREEGSCEDCRAAMATYMREYKKANREKVKAWNKKSSHNDNRDRLKPGAKAVYYNRTKILERDGYICYLCNEPTDPTATHIVGQPGWERYPHLDHVVPMALGGDDTADNVRTTHAKCNMDKGVSLSL